MGAGTSVSTGTMTRGATCVVATLTFNDEAEQYLVEIRPAAGHRPAKHGAAGAADLLHHLRDA